MLRACAQAGLVNNLNDALAWGLVPLYLSANGASVTEVGAVAAVYPAVWGLGQLLTGWLSDHTGRKPLIVAGMLGQAGALSLLVAGGGEFKPALLAAVLLGAGTALVYPTLIAAVSDAVQPVNRAPAVGVYRFWRDFGFVVGALITGIVADSVGSGEAIVVVAVLTGLSGVWVVATSGALTGLRLHKRDDASSGRGDTRQSKPRQVRRCARAARVAADHGHRGMLAVLPCGLRHPTRPELLHETTLARSDRGDLALGSSMNPIAVIVSTV